MATTRDELEARAWATTLVDYRGHVGERRAVLVLTTQGTTLAPLDTFSLEELRAYVESHERRCRACGGTGVLTGRVRSSSRGPLPGLDVPCPSCGGKGLRDG